MNTITKSEYALKVQTALYEEGMTTRICGSGVPPIVPYEQDGWTLERILKSDLESTMPAEVLKRIEGLEKYCNVYCYLIAHEIKEIEPPRVEAPRQLLDAVSRTLPVLGTMLCSLVMFLVTVASIVMGAFMALFLAVVLADPVLIAVIRTENDELIWLECSKWYE